MNACSRKFKSNCDFTKSFQTSRGRHRHMLKWWSWDTWCATGLLRTCLYVEASSLVWDRSPSVPSLPGRESFAYISTFLCKFATKCLYKRKCEIFPEVGWSWVEGHSLWREWPWEQANIFPCKHLIDIWVSWLSYHEKVWTYRTCAKPVGPSLLGWQRQLFSSKRSAKDTLKERTTFLLLKWTFLWATFTRPYPYGYCSYRFYGIINIVYILYLVEVKPWINCPDNIFQDLAPGKNTADVSSVWKEPTSNVQHITVNPPEISSSYQFPTGETKVEWTASNSQGSDSCAIYVIISGK